jgi:hypothetical protein
MIVRAQGHRTVATHIFDGASEYLDSDAVFAVKPSLLRDFVRRTADDPERPVGVTGPWYSVENDIVLVASDGLREPTEPRAGPHEHEHTDRRTPLVDVHLLQERERSSSDSNKSCSA